MYFIILERNQSNGEENVFEADTETLKHEDTSSLISMTIDDRVGEEERNEESLHFGSESSGYRTSSQISQQEHNTTTTRSFNYK